MKTMLTFILVASAFAAVASAKSGDLSSALERGLIAEEVNRDFDAAIAAYKSAVAQFDKERELAATAIFRLAENYRRTGRTGEAEVLYERIVREFHDQTELARLAAERLPEERVAAVETPPADEEAEEIERLKEILRHSPDLLFSLDPEREPREIQRGNTRLHEAILNGQLRLAEFLIERGINVMAENRRQETPLDLAVRMGSKSAVELLLKHGADSRSTDRFGRTLLHIATDRGFLSIAELLVGLSLDVNAETSYGSMPLHLAARSDQVQSLQLVGFLLKNGADPHALDRRGTALHQVARAEIAELLLDSGTEVDALAADGTTPLHHAVEKLNHRVAELLIERDADVNILDERGRSPLDYLPESRSVDIREMGELLRRHGATEGKFHAVILGPGEKERFVIWDRSETMTLTGTLAVAGVGIEDVDTREPLSEEIRRRTLAEEIVRRQVLRAEISGDPMPSVYTTGEVISARVVAAVLRDELEDVELGNGATIYLSDAQLLDRRNR